MLVFLSVPVRARELSLARQIRPPRPASAGLFQYLGQIWCLLTGEYGPLIPYLFPRRGPSIISSNICHYRFDRHRVSPEFISSSVHANAYHWLHLPPIVCRLDASSSQGSSSNGCCLFGYYRQIQSGYGDGQAVAGRDCRTRLARPNYQARARTGKFSLSLLS